jgi:hypothetical protein
MQLWGLIRLCFVDILIFEALKQLATCGIATVEQLGDKDLVLDIWFCSFQTFKRDVRFHSLLFFNQILLKIEIHELINLAQHRFSVGLMVLVRLARASIYRGS